MGALGAVAANFWRTNRVTGSQQRDLDAWSDTLDVVAGIFRRASDLGDTPSFVNLGGGFGVDYSGASREFPLERYAERLIARASTLDLINELRRELWASAIRPEHLTDFVTPHRDDTKSDKHMPSLCDALFYATA